MVILFIIVAALKDIQLGYSRNENKKEKEKTLNSTKEKKNWCLLPFS